MTGSQNIINALRQYTGASQNEATNAANKEVSSFDDTRALFISGSGKRQAASPSVHYQHRREIRGVAEATGHTGDLAIEKGDGYFVVKTKAGTVALSNMGSFRVTDTEKKIVGPSGEVLMGWALDAQGNAPANSTAMDSLIELSTKNISAAAVATDKVTLGAILNAEQDVHDGPGDIIDLQVNRVLKNTDLIAPGVTSTGSILLGDQMKFTPGNQGATLSTFEYGGISISKKAGTSTSALYNATSATAPFNVLASGTAATATSQLAFGAGFSIRLGANGKLFNFTATTAANEASQGRFNSLSTLADAINSTTNGNIRATISDGRLLIAGKDANSALVMTNINPPGGALPGFLETIGLIDIDANDPAVTNVERYASLSEYRDKLVKNADLTGELIGRKLRFGSAEATSSLKIDGESYRARNYRRAYITNGADTSNRNVITIESPSHGLQTGDYVRLSGNLQVTVPGGAAQNPVPDGMYRIERTGTDTFTVAGVVFLDAGAGATPAASSLNIVTNANLGNLTWRKVQGLEDEMLGGGGNTVRAAIAGDYANVTIALLNPISGVEELDAGDMVYIGDSNILKDGYYRVDNVAGQNVRVIARRVNGTVDFKGDVYPGDGNAPDAQAKVTKVSGRNVAGQRLDTYPVLITANSRIVTIDKNPNHVYQDGDIVVFTDLAADVVTVAGATIRANTPYTISVANANSNNFSIELPLADTPGAIAGGQAMIGYDKFDAGAGALGANIANGAVAAGVSTSLGPNAQITNLGKMFDGMGMSTDLAYFANARPATYSGGSVDTNIASGNVDAHRTHTISVYDSLGIAHNVNVSYLRLTNNKWAVEVWVPKNDDGTYDVQMDSDISNRITYGNIEFDGNGNIVTLDPALEGEQAFVWANGANQSSIEFDFGYRSEDGLGIKLQGDFYDERFLDANGNKAGSVEYIEYAEDGKITARFTNGTQRAFAQLPVAVVQDPNGLTNIGNGHFITNEQKSGAPILKIAGVGGAGTFLSGFLEASKVDENESLLNITELNHLRSIALKAVSKEEEVNKLAVQLL